MRKSDYDALVEMCSVQRADAPYTVWNAVPPANLGSVEITHSSGFVLDDTELAKQVAEEWIKHLEGEKEKLASEGVEAVMTTKDAGSPAPVLIDAKSGDLLRYSRPIIKYNGHILTVGDDQEATITIETGTTNYAEHRFAHKLDHTKAAWCFGPSSVVIVEDDEDRRYVLFGDRAKNVAHTDQEFEREFFPKGYFYLDDMPRDDEGWMTPNDKGVLEVLVRKQLAAQSNFPAEMVEIADIETMGFFLIPEPHYDVDSTHAIHVRLPCKAADFGQFHKGTKYDRSSLVPLEELPQFVEEQGQNLVPIARLLIWQYLVRHPELVE